MEISDWGKVVAQRSGELFKITTLAAALALAGCGGSGTADTIAPANGGGTGSGGDTGSTDTGGTGATDTAKAKVSSAKSLDASGNETNTFDDKGGVFEVVVVNAKNQPASGVKVVFSADNGAIVFANSNSSVLTDKEGKAKLAFSSNDPTLSGAFELTASTTVDGEAVTEKKNITLTAKKVVSTANPKIALAQVLVDNTPSTNVGASGGTFRVMLQNGAGEPLSGKKVSFSSDSPDIVFANTSKAVLTDDKGIAQLSFAPSSPTLSGAYTLTTQAQVGEASLSETVDISLQSANIELNNLTLGQTNLPSAGQTKVEVATLDAASKKGINGITVNFTTECGVITPQSLASSGAGNVLVSYSSVKADGRLCSGPVKISATAVGSPNAALDKTIQVAPAKPTHLTYTDGQNDIIPIMTDGAPSQKQIEFVLYSDGTPLSGESVVFNLSKNPGGVKIGTLDNNKEEYKVVTNDKGKAFVNIYSGPTQGPVEIKAYVESKPNITASATGISIANGRPSQKGISLAMSSNNIHGWNIDGTSATLTIRVADSQGNPVPDGTVVNFTAEGGQIQQSCETKKVNKVSVCDVNFVSQNPRPKDGRVTIMAVIEGEKTYIDANKNNAFDANEKFLTNIGDTFRDDNENGKYDAGELLYLREGTSAGTEPCFVADPANPNQVKPSVASQPNIEGTCNKKVNALLRSQVIMLLASDVPVAKNIPLSAAARMNSARIKIWTSGPADGAGNPINPMPQGTKISASLDLVKDSKCELRTVQGGVKEIPKIVSTSFIKTYSTAGNVVPDLGTVHTFFTKGECKAGDLMVVQVDPGTRGTTFNYVYNITTGWVPMGF